MRHVVDVEERTDSPEIAASETRFLIDLGKRIRELRDRRSISRKLLARQSQVSERYLAQIESGNGNVSIVLLRRVAMALGVDTAQLLAVGEPSDRRNRIALIGLRGAGKSTLGAMLAKHLAVPLVELNREVTRDTGLPVGEVMALYGLTAYRRIERRALERIARERERAVIVAGGGIVSDDEAFAFLLSNCYTVWIKARPEEHMARVLAQGDFRPMAGNATAMDDLRRILATREGMYAKADAVVDTSGESPRQSFAKLRHAATA